MNDFGKALQDLNEEYDARGVNSSTRVKWMFTSALIHLDVFKIQHHPGRTALTEKEFLDMAKRCYWEARAQLQKETGG